MILCKCPKCQAVFEIGDELAGRKLRCGNCQTAFYAPVTTAAPVPPRAVPAAPVAPIPPPTVPKVIVPPVATPPPAVPKVTIPPVAKPPPATSPAASAPEKKSVKFTAPAVKQPAEDTMAAPKRQGINGRSFLKIGLALLILLAAGIGAWLAIRPGKPASTDADVVKMAPVPTKPRPTGPPADRVANYTEALARAKETGKDIVVLQRGSDWNRLGEILYDEVWSTEDFARELGDKFILVDVDLPEVIGSRPLPVPAPKEPETAASDSDAPPKIDTGNQPPMRLARLTDDKNPPPPDELTAVESEGKVPFAKRHDGAFVVDGISSGPNQDILIIKAKAKTGGGYLRIDFPIDPSLPGNGPGTAPNGNSIIGELEIFCEGKPVEAMVAASVSQSNGGRVAAKIFDGIKFQGDKGWDAEDSGWELGVGKPAILLVALRNPIPADAEVTVRVTARSKWGQHVPGSCRVAILAGKPDIQNPALPLPENEITGIESEQKTPFKKRPDGTVVAKMAPNPGQDVLTLNLKTARGGQVLRLDFPTDPCLPGTGPGRAGNGNFGIGEVEILNGPEKIKPSAAWASYTEGGWGAWQTIDGISDKNDNAWNPGAHLHKRRSLLLALDKAVPAGTDLTVRLICRTAWGQHVPGCVSAAMLSDQSIAGDVAMMSAAMIKSAKDAAFSWRDNTFCPRLALMDSQGRAVACEKKPRATLNYETMAERIRKMRDLRAKRDELWASAEKAAGPAKAELLRQSMDVLGFANWPGNGNCYKPIHDEIRKADPQDESGAVRWLGFGGDIHGGTCDLTPVWKARDAKNFEEAIALVDKAVKDPRNKILTNEQIQRLIMAKFHIYRSWPGHEEQRFDVQCEIAAFDPLTYWGIGAIGYLACFDKNTEPMLTSVGPNGGWKARHIKAGTDSSWSFFDTMNYFDHAGPYKVRLNFGGGKDSIKIKRLALLEGTTVVAEATPNADVGPGKNVETDLLVTSWNDDARHTLRVEYAAETGRTDSNGNFSFEPLLPELAAKSQAPPVVPDFMLLQKQLGDKLMAVAAQGEDGARRILADASLRAKLTQYEIIRSCTPDKVAAVAKQEGGAAFLKEFFGNTAWMESFLVSEPADFGQSLENLRLICQRCQGWQTPIYRRLATAMALSWGSGNRYRLVDRFNHIQRAHRGGLMHAYFDSYTVREMRWAIDLAGSAKEFQFMLDDRQHRLGDYFGACWAVAYRDPNDYGDSVQGWLYATPWVHGYGNGQGDRPFLLQRQVGGVCGTLSGFGSLSARAHGIMSVTVGQPGHCAYIIRVNDEWPVGYSVTWPTGAGVPGWDGVGYSTLHRLYEPVQSDRPRYLAANRLAWVARLLVDRSVKKARFLPGLTYKQYSLPNGALPDFKALTPVKTGDATGIDLGPAMPANASNFGVVWEGEIEVEGNGLITVSTQSDDASQVLIDGNVLVAANCNRVEKEIDLAPGKHAVRAEYTQGGGNYGMAVDFAGVRSPGSWQQTYELAIAAQPTNYGTWIEYIKELEKAKNVPAATWLELGRRAAKTFNICNEAGWALTTRCLNRADLPQMTLGQRIDLLAELNRELRQDNWLRPEGYPLDGWLNWQADRIGDPQKAVEFFGQLLVIHHSQKPENNWIFNYLMGWGANRFASNPATAPAYAKAMETYFRSQGSAADKGQMASAIAAGIRKASELGDRQSYILWSDMATALLPPLQPADVHLNDAQAKAYPKLTPFPGILLSRDGMLQTSSACAYDKPLSYRTILSGEFGGWFDTNNEEKPWAQVQLAGDCEISGIILIDRYEYTNPNDKGQMDELKWAVPLKIMVSTDGKTWTEVLSGGKVSPDKVYRIPLQDKVPRARYVRIERLPGTDKTVPPGRFHFRNFLVYGKKLY